MSDLIIQQFDEAEIRIIDENGEPLFCAKDVCDVLGYGNSREALSKHCREGGVTKRDTPTSSGEQLMAYINEGNLYRLIAKSKLPAAERFESWVFDEVLPSIRKKGHYGKDPVELLNDPSAMRGLLLTYSEKVIALEKKVETDAPKVTFYDSFANTDGLYNLQNAARALGKQPNLFIRKLKEKYLFYQGKSLVPYIQYRQRGLFDVKVTIVDDKQRAQTFITPKGLQFFGSQTQEAVA
ncbi:MAG: BRO family protein [Rickettsiales bacterium]